MAIASANSNDVAEACYDNQGQRLPQRGSANWEPARRRTPLLVVLGSPLQHRSLARAFADGRRRYPEPEAPQDLWAVEVMARRAAQARTTSAPSSLLALTA